MNDSRERPLRLLVVDDHEVVRQGLVALLDRLPPGTTELMVHPDFREGFDAFMAKRPPRFAGAPE